MRAMPRLAPALALALGLGFAGTNVALGQQQVDEEVPGKHKKPPPPPPAPAPAPAPAAQKAPSAEPAPEATPKKGKKQEKKTKKKKGAPPAETTTTPAAPLPPASTPPPALPPPAAPAPAPPVPETTTRPAAPPPAVAPAAQEAPPPSARVSEEVAPGAVTHSAGLRLRYITVPGWFLGAFTQQNVPLNSVSFAGEYVRRKENLDIVVSLDFSFMSPSDGNWLGNNHPASTDTDFLQFKGLKIISFDVSFIWHHPFTETFLLEYGAGVGIGFVPGDILRISDGTPGCVTSPGDVTRCYPIVCAQGPCTQAELDAHKAPPNVHDDSASAPAQFVDDNKPPVVPIVNLLIGLVWQVHPKARVRFEGGFHDAFFLGVASEYRF